MKKTKYLCVDDEPDIPATKRRLEAAGPLLITLERPVADWADQVQMIQARINCGHSGLLIDFRLDETHQAKPKKKPAKGKLVRFTAESLISELRRRSVENGKDASYPIVLWSTAKFLEEFYEVSGVSWMAFDDIWNKAEVTEHREHYAAMLVSLSAGYNALKVALGKNHVRIGPLLAAEESSLVREFDQFISKRTRGQPYAFQYALFLKHDILDVPGALINGEYLRAILGVENLDDSVRDRLLEALGAQIRYKGVFADSHVRYWRDVLVKQLEAVTGTGSWLSLGAEERVALLMKVLKRTRLDAAKPIVRDYSTDYDCVCALSHRPLAKRNGYRLLDSRPLPWKEPYYVAGPEYRKRYQDLVKKKPLESDDAERFILQYSISR